MESRRTEKGVRQYTLLNLGVDFSLPKEQWPDLTKRIEEILGGQQSLLDIDMLVQSCAAKIIASRQDACDPGERDSRESCRRFGLLLAALPASAMMFSFGVEEVDGKQRKVSRWAFSEVYHPSSGLLVSAVQPELS